MARAKNETNHRSPLRLHRFTNESHARFMRQPIRLTRVTLDARTDNVLPGRLSSVMAWNDVIKVQLFARENLGAVLALVLVAFEHVIPRQLQFFTRQLVEESKQNDTGKPNRSAGGVYGLKLSERWIHLREIDPVQHREDAEVFIVMMND